jgi:hypothetical protein
MESLSASSVVEARSLPTKAVAIADVTRQRRNVLVLMSSMLAILAVAGLAMTDGRGAGDGDAVVVDTVNGEVGDCSDGISSSTSTGACIKLESGKTAQLPTLLFLGVQKGATTSVALQMMQIFDDMRVCGSILSDGNVNTEKHYFNSDENYDFPQVCLPPPSPPHPGARIYALFFTAPCNRTALASAMTTLQIVRR